MILVDVNLLVYAWDRRGPLHEKAVRWLDGKLSESARVGLPWECLLGTILVMGSAIIAEKIKQGAPDLIVRPNVGSFRALDFLQASAVLRAADPVKKDLKKALPALLDG